MPGSIGGQGRAREMATATLLLPEASQVLWGQTKRDVFFAAITAAVRTRARNFSSMVFGGGGGATGRWEVGT
jgi:hypothetical protein